MTNEEISEKLNKVGPCIYVAKSEGTCESMKKLFTIIKKLYSQINKTYGKGSVWTKTNGKTSCISLHWHGDIIHGRDSLIGKFKTSIGRTISFIFNDSYGDCPLNYFNDNDIYVKTWIPKNGMQDGILYTWKEIEYIRKPGTEYEYVDFSLDDCKLLIDDLVNQIINKYVK